MAVTDVPLRLIDPNPFQIRKVPASSVKALAAEMAELGFWSGGILARKVGSRYQLAFGHRRVAALKLNGQKKVKLDIQKLTDDEMLAALAAENFQRDDLSGWEKLKTYEQVKKSDYVVGKKNQLAKILGLSPGQLRRFQHASDICADDKEIAAALRRGDTAISVISEMSVLPQKKRREMVKKRTTRKEVKAYKQHHARKKARKKAPPLIEDLVDGWANSMHFWIEELKEVTPYAKQVREAKPVVARKFLTVAGKLRKALEALERKMT